MEPVESSEPVDLDCDPRNEKGAESYGHLASVSMSRERCDSSREELNNGSFYQKGARDEKNEDVPEGPLRQYWQPPESGPVHVMVC